VDRLVCSLPFLDRSLYLLREDIGNGQVDVLVYSEIYTVNADGTGQPTGFANPVYGADPAWSPHGARRSLSWGRHLGPQRHKCER
jgi:hypothetical protein